MRMREPLLYEQYIGQYLTDEEVSFYLSSLFTVRFGKCWVFLSFSSILQVLERSQEAMLDDAPGASPGGTGGLANLLLNSYQERLIQNRLQEEQEREEGAQEEDEDDDGESEIQMVLEL